MADVILVINAGSSSVKFSLFEVDGRALRLTSKGQLDGVGTQPRLRTRDAAGATLSDEKLSAAEVPDVTAGMTYVSRWLR